MSSGSAGLAVFSVLASLFSITRGTGLESALSISTLGTILDDKMEPNWVSGDYDAGVCATVAAIADKLCGIYGVTLDTSSVANNTSGRNGESNIMGFIMVIIAVILIIWVISTLTRPPRPPRGGGPRGGVGRDMFWYSMGRASRRPRRPPPPPLLRHPLWGAVGGGRWQRAARAACRLCTGCFWICAQVFWRAAC